MEKYETLTILLDNLSSTYVFTLILTTATIICTFICSKYVNSCLQKKNDQMKTTANDLRNEDDEQNSNELSKGFLGQIRSAKLRKLEELLTEEQKVEEKNIEKEQLAAIYKLLKEQESIYQTKELDENALKEQLKLYR
ncbi:matrix-remodeling-associated protein 7-like [Condylostylus longicornis]|uniref:matrix-remodeling-associated protein 7-like n=1 Tax=Condylostylus longicornis TaxID=2530218 RepID=UPI00244D9D6E|nr:matrix-remodeling-associated protein 7-like [Condylostylus longicornis]